jgi:hypothetical protein
MLVRGRSSLTIPSARKIIALDLLIVFVYLMSVLIFGWNSWTHLGSGFALLAVSFAPALWFRWDLRRLARESGMDSSK